MAELSQDGNEWSSYQHVVEMKRFVFTTIGKTFCRAQNALVCACVENSWTGFVRKFIIKRDGRFV